MRNRRWIAALTAVLFSSQLSLASELPQSFPVSQPVFLSLPRGESVQGQRGMLRGYALEEFKILLRIYADYRSWGNQVSNLQKEVNNFRKLSALNRKHLRIQDEEVDLLKKENTRLFEKWQRDNQLKHECENRPSLGSWIAWTAAAAAAVVAAVLVGVILIEE